MVERREPHDGASREPTVDERPWVDVTLIDAMLQLSPEERLRQNDRMVRTVKELRDGFAARRADDAAGQPRGRRR
jgi:hypothetical protein